MSVINYNHIGDSQAAFSFYGGYRQSSYSHSTGIRYQWISSNNLINETECCEDAVDKTAKWFLHKTSMSSRKLQKLCYYAYCWYIVWFNDIVDIQQNEGAGIHILWREHFQVWIHGPVLPSLYSGTKPYGWHDIPKVGEKPVIPGAIEELLEEVWNAYGDFSADELEAISRQESPWRNARKDLGPGEPCLMRFSTWKFWNITWFRVILVHGCRLGISSGQFGSVLSSPSEQC